MPAKPKLIQLLYDLRAIIAAYRRGEKIPEERLIRAATSIENFLSMGEPNPLQPSLDETFEHRPLPTEARARATDPDTSHAAAKAIRPEQLRHSQEVVLRAFRIRGEDGATDEEAEKEVSALGIRCTPSGVRTRRCEIQRAGLVEYTEEKRKLDTGGHGRVHRITDLGHAFLNEIDRTRHRVEEPTP